VASARRIDALTGLRPFASLYVFFFHFGRPLLVSAPAWLHALAGAGFVGVSFFYVLSGFVLALSYGPRILAGQFDHRRFLVRRWSRLAPAYLVAFALLIPIGVRHGWPLGRGLLQLLMLQAWWPPAALSWNLPAWSISVEIAFYLLFPWLVRLCRRGGLATPVFAWLAALVIAGTYSVVAPDGPVGPDTEAFYLDFLKFWPLARLPEFALGVALGLRFDRDRPAPRWLGPVAGAVLVAVLTQSERLPFALVHNALLLPCFGAIVWSAASAHGIVGRILSSPPLYRLGRASYDIYILQMPLMFLVWPRYVLPFALLVYGVGLGFHLLIEGRAQRLLARLLSVDPGEGRAGEHARRARELRGHAGGHEQTVAE
jgi:peptidoglycan/LPS O-acetylase OafA/YrhL